MKSREEMLHDSHKSSLLWFDNPAFTNQHNIKSLNIAKQQGEKEIHNSKYVFFSIFKFTNFWKQM